MSLGQFQRLYVVGFKIVFTSYADFSTCRVYLQSLETPKLPKVKKMFYISMRVVITKIYIFIKSIN